MHTERIETVVIRGPRRPAWRERLWREWCFARAAVLHRRWSLLFLVSVMLVGGLLFQWLEPEKNHSFPQAAFYTWALIFGEPPEEFPANPVLAGLFFVVPVLGLVVVLEGILDLSLMLRDRRQYERAWCMTMAQSMRGHVILVGLGRLGYRTFLMLRKLGCRVVVLESSPQNQFLEDVRRDGSPLFVGDARREAFLNDANIAGASAIVLATTDDLANLEIALDARRLNPNIRVVLRMFDQNMADKVRESFAIHSAMSQATISAPAFATAAVDPDIVNSVIVDERLVVMVRWRVRAGGPLCGRSVGELAAEERVAVVEHRPLGGGCDLFPPPRTVIGAGDELIVQGEYDRIAALKMGLEVVGR